MEKPTKKSTAARATGAAKTTRAMKPAATTGVRRTTTSAKPAARATKTSTLVMESSTATAVLDEPRVPSHDEIALRAHILYEQSGCAQGRDAEFWLEAERQVLEELNR